MRKLSCVLVLIGLAAYAGINGLKSGQNVYDWLGPRELTLTINWAWCVAVIVLALVTFALLDITIGHAVDDANARSIHRNGKALNINWWRLGPSIAGIAAVALILLALPMTDKHDKITLDAPPAEKTPDRVSPPVFNNPGPQIPPSQTPPSRPRPRFVPPLELGLYDCNAGWYSTPKQMKKCREDHKWSPTDPGTGGPRGPLGPTLRPGEFDPRKVY